MGPTELLNAAFAAAVARAPSLGAKWIKISHLIGGRLPHSLLAASILREGELDQLLRCLEDDAVTPMQSGDGSFAHRLGFMTVYWVGGMYEILRRLREAGLGDGEIFDGLMVDFELVRIPLEKHQIAQERKLGAPLHLAPIGSPAGAATFIYDLADRTRSHIMPAGVSPRGSMIWQAIDVKGAGQRWIERRELSDRILALWGGN